MSRFSRMLLIIGVIVLLGLSALYFTAKKIRTAVQDEPRQVEQVSVDNSVPIPVTEGATAAEVAGIPEHPVAEEQRQPDPQEAEVPAGGPSQADLVIFADARHEVWEVLEKYPKTRDSILKELTDTVDTDRVRMYNYEMVEIRIARSRPLRAAGMEEEVYKEIREQYRAYRAGEAGLNPAFKAAFDAAPEDVMARADLKGFDLLDY